MATMTQIKWEIGYVEENAEWLKQSWKDNGAGFNTDAYLVWDYIVVRCLICNCELAVFVGSPPEEQRCNDCE